MTRALLRVLLVTLALGIAAVPRAHAYTDEQIREAVETRLKELHPSDTPEWWRSLGPTTPAVLMAMYRDRNWTYARIRILQALSWFSDDPQVVEFLKAQAESTKEETVRNAVLRALGLTQGAKERDFVAKFLKDADADTRFAAAESLKTMGDAGANELLEKYLAQEKTPWIAGKLAKVEVPLAQPVSADTLSPEFGGSWGGFFVRPTQPAGMESLPVSMKIEASAKNLKGDFEVRTGTKTRRWEIARVSGKDTQVDGELVAVGEKKAERALFHAELIQSARGAFLELRISDQGAFLILRRARK